MPHDACSYVARESTTLANRNTANESCQAPAHRRVDYILLKTATYELKGLSYVFLLPNIGK
ncbi:hypothetical protein BN2476_960083 [Paraburkholderia piptadeniae]|uniref:Uncharacterized protein n=1 Tax=Paraburkholderia piptadeniae TaxID=1701573 RepID=A0A1N7SUB8_9BURK|nr:hypothetical protein BN2476_960083 [Paraburkholderia piptadeniae]